MDQITRLAAGFLAVALISGCSATERPAPRPGTPAERPPLGLGGEPLDLGAQQEAIPAETTMSLDDAGFGFPAGSDIMLGQGVPVWFTNYYTPVYTAAPDDDPDTLPLIDTTDRPISPNLTVRNWCDVGLQGTAAIEDRDGERRAYVIADWQGEEQVDCDAFLGNLSKGIKVATRKSRYRRTAHAYGCGVRNMPLVPYRTVAVDQAFIPYRTTIFVPSLRGREFSLDGRTVVHDGFLFAADRGGAIKGNHLDFFSGHDRRTPFGDIVTSDEGRPVIAVRVPDSHPATTALMALHRPPC